MNRNTVNIALNVLTVIGVIMVVGLLGRCLQGAGGMAGGCGFGGLLFIGLLSAGLIVAAISFFTKDRRSTLP
ncbi:MAG TPA: hypothetical protein VNI84_09600 [Pyrinomonadaceae bacterium]|nr:hypothetical protein [Pyrinomonadaceae bacterium]